MGTTRRELLASSFGASAGLVVGAGSGHAAPAAAALTGVTYLPPSYRGLMWGMSGFVDRLKNAVSEPSAVKLVTSGAQAKADEQLSALRSGSADFMFHTSSYITRSFEILGVIGLPSLVEALYEHGDRLMMESPLWTLINRQLAQSDLFMLSAGGGAAEPEYVWSRERAAATLDDLRGRRCRVVGHEASTALAKFGVVPVRIPSSDTSKALQEGTVDAIVANISTVIGRGLQEHLRSCYKLPTTGFVNAVFMLKSRWDALDEPTRQALWKAGKWYDQNAARHLNDEVYPKEYWPTVKKAGVEVVGPTARDTQRFADASQEIWSWWKSRVGETVGRHAIDLAQGKAV